MSGFVTTLTLALSLSLSPKLKGGLLGTGFEELSLVEMSSDEDVLSPNPSSFDNRDAYSILWVVNTSLWKVMCVMSLSSSEARV